MAFGNVVDHYKSLTNLESRSNLFQRKVIFVKSGIGYNILFPHNE